MKVLPFDPVKDLIHLLGYNYLQHQKYELAEIVFRNLSAWYPQEGLFVFSYAYALYLLGKFKESQGKLKNLKKLLVKNQLRAFFLLESKILWALGKKEEARESYYQHLKQDHEPAAKS